MAYKELLICGFGGQGVIFAGVLIGNAAVKAGLEASQSAAYGSEARGSACHAGVVISDKPISYPKTRIPDLMIALSQAGYDKFISSVSETGYVLYDEDIVTANNEIATKQIPAKFTEIASDIGNRSVANVVASSAAISLMGIFDTEILKETISENSPKAFLDLNLKAFEAGCVLAQNIE